MQSNASARLAINFTKEQMKASISPDARISMGRLVAGLFANAALCYRSIPSIDRQAPM
jgi:hypothetical protein